MRRSAEAILHELGVTEPHEIDVEAIAYHCDAIVRYRPLDTCEARIVAIEASALITVNELSRPERQRFSVAHELGHWVGDRRAAGFFCTAEMIETSREFVVNPETRANAFAADLLMPSYLFVPRTRMVQTTIDGAETLAADFSCSLTATSIRLVELGGRPSIVACYDRTRRKWFRRSPKVPEAFWPVQDLQEDSDAYELLKRRARPGTKSSPALCPANCWIDRRDSNAYTITEQSVVIDSDVVLTMLWWKDERQILEYKE